MMAYSALFRIVKPGQTICLKTRDGSEKFTDRSGVVMELSQEGLVLDTASGIEYITADDIITWRLPKSESLVVDPPPILTTPELLQDSTQNEPKNQPNPVQQNLIIQEKTIESSIRASEELEILFAGEPTISISAPSFKFSGFEGGQRKEIDRWRNRYEYAMKVREPARMSQDVAAVSELAETLNNADLYVLAGFFAYISGLGLNCAGSYYAIAAKMR